MSQKTKPKPVKSKSSKATSKPIKAKPAKPDKAKPTKPKAIKPKHFARMFQEWRDRKSYSQRDAADALGISIKSLQNWEQERSMPQGIGLAILVKMLQGGGLLLETESKKNKK